MGLFRFFLANLGAKITGITISDAPPGMPSTSLLITNADAKVIYREVALL
jgi:hypothetical protein